MFLRMQVIRYTTRVLAVAAILLVAGCADQKSSRLRSEYFLFNEDSKTGLWRSRYDDFVAIAKAYAKEKNIPFEFEGTSAFLQIYQQNRTLIAHVRFEKFFGSPFLAVDIDTAGKVLRHQTGISEEGPVGHR